MSFTVHYQLEVYHCRSWLHKRHGVWVRIVEFVSFYKLHIIPNYYYSQGGLTSGRRPVVKIIAEFLSQHDENMLHRPHLVE
jgi:hypothetical protein